MIRYPHSATIKVKTLVGEPFPEEVITTLDVKGRYEPNANNKSLDYSAKFYCPLIDLLKEDAHALDGQTMIINGRTIGISTAWNYQIHCEIWLD